MNTRERLEMKTPFARLPSPANGLLRLTPHHPLRLPIPPRTTTPTTTTRMSTHSGPSTAALAALAARLPKGTWDTHMHVVDLARFPAASTGQYAPSSHTAADARAFFAPLGIERLVIVQPSFYGTDNGCTLDALRQLGPDKGRAVLQFDPAQTGAETLREWHALGVRGVRLNFRSVGAALEAESLARSLRRYADAVRGFGWVLETYIAMEDIPLLEPIVAGLGDDVKLCIDHFGHPAAASLATAQSVAGLPGWAALAKLLRERENVWVKVSAAYRLDRDPKHPLVRSLGREILRLRPGRCVFATDWPHTRFDGLDVTVYLQEMLDWCEAEGVDIRKVCVDNAEELFDCR